MNIDIPAGMNPRALNSGNIHTVLAAYERAVADMTAERFAGLQGFDLLHHLKRDTTKSGPYPGVSFFEASNRCLTDLVILHGVKWLLESDAFPFEEYRVEYGHEDKHAHDIAAQFGALTLAGEAFNTAPSFFNTKNGKTRAKLAKTTADFRIVIANHDAPGPKPGIIEGGFLLLIDTRSGAGDLRGNLELLQRAA